jgi:hypothetical protein
MGRQIGGHKPAILGKIREPSAERREQEIRFARQGRSPHT